jgi:hypothetical protein
MHAAQTATAWAYRQTCRCRHFATKRSAQTPCPLKNSLGNCAICLFVACLGKTSNPVFDLIKFTHDSNELILRAPLRSERGEAVAVRLRSVWKIGEAIVLKQHTIGSKACRQQRCIWNRYHSDVYGGSEAAW